MLLLVNRRAGHGHVHVKLQRHVNTLCNAMASLMDDAGPDALVTCPMCLDSRNWNGAMKGVQAAVVDGGRMYELDGRYYVETVNGSSMGISAETANAMLAVWRGCSALEPLLGGVRETTDG